MPSDERMLADGILSPAQAALLRESLGAGHGPLGTTDRVVHGRRFRAAFKWALLFVVAVAILGLFLAGTGPEPAATVPQDVTATLNDPGGIGQMNQRISSVLAVALLLVVPLLLWMWLHNSLVAREEAVFEAWA